MAYIVEYGGTIPPPPVKFTVTNLNDSGDGSLRSAIAQANLAPGAQTVDFAPGLTGTIVLTSGQMNINEAVTIVGPGADKITIDGSALGRVFSIFEDASDVCVTPGVDFPVSISGLTLTRGQRNVQNNPGGAIYSEKSLALNSVVITSSVAAAGGGVGIQTLYAGQSIDIRNSSFIDNVAKPIAGANVANNGGGLLVRERCSTVTSGVTVDIDEQPVPGQSHRADGQCSSAGAGIYVLARANVSITDTRIVGNTIVTQNPPVASQNNRGGGISVESASPCASSGPRSPGIPPNAPPACASSCRTPALQTARDGDGREDRQLDVAGNVGTASLRSGAVGVYGNVALEVDNSTVAGNTSTADCRRAASSSTRG